VSQTTGSGIHWGGSAKTPSLVLSDVLKVHSSGAIMMTPPSESTAMRTTFTARYERERRGPLTRRRSFGTRGRTCAIVEPVASDGAC
jgi:hypothetical protein